MTKEFLESGSFNIREAGNASGIASPDFIPVENPKNIWKDEKQPWAATPSGRLAIRAVSRGIMGAAFYAWGGQKATADMAGYDPENPQNFIQHIAKFFDVAAGKPIKKIFGENAVTFRPTLDRTGARTLGEDVVDNTFNFAMATVGDAVGRNIVGLFDPNAEAKWRDETGKVNFPKALKGTIFAAGRVFEAQMEDWFVAVPYAYQKKAQRKVINKISPGFEYDADRALNGSSFKVDESGNVIGTYTLEGAIDLQGRFTGYNIGTMMFRDAMKSAKKKLGHHFDREDQELEVNLPASPGSVARTGVDGIRNSIRYTIKSAVKATLIMTPSVPFFWSMRTTQGKHNSLLIGPDGKPLHDAQGINIRNHRENWDSAFGITHDGRRVKNQFADPDFDPYSPTYGTIDTMINPFGKAAHNATIKAQEIAAELAGKFGKDVDGAKDFTNRYVNGTMAYTPYIYAKNEFAHRWDNAQMDSSIYRAIDGAFSFNLKEMKAGMKDIRSALRQKGADLHPSHPETIPEEYDRERKGFVRRTSKDSGQEKGADWRQKITSARNDTPELGR